MWEETGDRPRFSRFLLKLSQARFSVKVSTCPDTPGLSPPDTRCTRFCVGSIGGLSSSQRPTTGNRGQTTVSRSIYRSRPKTVVCPLFPRRQLRKYSVGWAAAPVGSLPRRQLRKRWKPCGPHRRSSLPRRQLRKTPSCLMRAESGSLPRRQLRKRCRADSVTVSRSLPRRQLRKGSGGMCIGIGCSLPRRQLRNNTSRTIK